jgi:hypothetical protein
MAGVLAACDQRNAGLRRRHDQCGGGRVRRNGELSWAVPGMKPTES